MVISVAETVTPLRLDLPITFVIDSDSEYVVEAVDVTIFGRVRLKTEPSLMPVTLVTLFRIKELETTSLRESVTVSRPTALVTDSGLAGMSRASASFGSTSSNANILIKVFFSSGSCKKRFRTTVTRRLLSFWFSDGSSETLYHKIILFIFHI